MDSDIVEINIKNIKNKYDIYLNKQINKNNIITFEGKNIITKESILIDVYTHNIIFFAKRIINNIININNPYIINIIDIIIDNSNIYFIYPYYKKITIDIQFKKKYIIQIINAFRFLFDNNIFFYNIDISDIYINNDSIIILPKFIESKPNKQILYGSPLFSPPNIDNFKNDREDILVENIMTIFIELYFKKSISINDLLLDIDDNDKYYYILLNIFNNRHNISLVTLHSLFNNNKLNSNLTKKKKINLFNMNLNDSDYYLFDIDL